MAGSGPCERQGSSAPVGLEFAACTPADVDNAERCGKGVPMPAVARSGALHAHTDQQPESKPQPEDPPGRVGAGPVPVEQPRQALATTSRELSDGFVLGTSGLQSDRQRMRRRHAPGSATLRFRTSDLRLVALELLMDG